MRVASGGRTSSFRFRCTRTRSHSIRSSRSLTPGLANVCAQYYYYFERKQQWIDRVIAATQKASATGSEEPEIQCAEAWVLFAEGRYDEAVDKIRTALGRDPDLDGGYYLLGRALFSAGTISGSCGHHGRRACARR